MARGTAPPPKLLASYTTNIPKAEHRGDTDGLATRRAAELRPLVLMQTAAKLIAYVANEYLADVAEKTVCGQQRGFVRNRHISDNIIELEGAMAMFSQAAERSAAGLLLDFANDFPSLDHDFMWKVLETMRVSPKIIRIVHLLYHQLVTEILYKGRDVASHPIASGIKQRCPLSGTLFALTLDRLIRHYLCTITLRSSVICAFADDLGLAMLDMYRQLPIILAIVCEWFLATGLKLKGSKCILIPLFPDFEDIIPWAAALPGIAGIEVSGFGRCLGVEIGPAAHLHQWASVRHKATARIGENRAGGKSLSSRIFMFNTCVASLFTYIAQFGPIPTEIHKFYKHCTQHITTWQAMPATLLADLSLLGIPTSIRDLSALSSAARLTCITRSAIAPSVWRDFEDFQRSDERASTPGGAGTTTHWRCRSGRFRGGRGQEVSRSFAPRRRLPQGGVQRRPRRSRDTEACNDDVSTSAGSAVVGVQ